MKLPTRIQVVMVTAICLFSCAGLQTSAKLSTKEQASSVASLEREMPIGHLGVPLGTVVRVTGEGYDGPWDRKAYAGKTLIRILTVNGKKLAEPVLFEFERAPKTVEKPAPRESFDYYVHEYGRFDGVVEPPEELGLQKSGLSHDGFHYRPGLTIHASNDKPK